MDKLIEAVEKLTEEIKKLQAQRVVEHHYHYTHTYSGPFYTQPQYIPPTIPSRYTVTCGSGILPQPAT